MREFETAVAAIVEGEWIEWDIIEKDPSGNEVHRQHCRAVREPTDGQIAFLMSHNSRHIGTPEKVAALLNFFDSALDDDTQAYVTKRLLDPHDRFGLKEIQEMLQGLMEDWSGRPTVSVSGSTSSPPSTGTSSNLVIQGSISSASPPTPS